MANHQKRAGTTEGVMCRVLENMEYLWRSELLQGTRGGWHGVIIEPGPSSDDAAVCLLTDNEPPRLKGHAR